MSNVGLTQPYVADHTAVYSVPLQSGVDLGLVPFPTGVDPVDYTVDIILGIIGFLLVVYLVGGCVYNKRRGKGCTHPHIIALLIGVGLTTYRPSASKMASGGSADSAKVIDEPAPIKKKVALFCFFGYD